MLIERDFQIHSIIFSVTYFSQGTGISNSQTFLESFWKVSFLLSMHLLNNRYKDLFYIKHF